MTPRHTQLRKQFRVTGLNVLAASALLATGCSHKTQIGRQTAHYQAPPTTTATAHNRPHPAPAPDFSSKPSPYIAATPPPVGFFDDTTGKPVFTETGIASWYAVNPRHRYAADGTIFDENAMTAAHRTLPLGSTVRVTNLTTNQSVLVRITDRGPFSPTRVLDLSAGAAKAIGMYRAGIAKVQLEAFPHPGADPEGHWCVQTGAFKTETDAIDLKAALLARYRGAKVIEFPGPTGYWVRADPPEHDRKTADKIADWIGAPDEQSRAYLVRTN